MEIQLPSTADVARAIEIWSTGDPRLTALLDRYDEPAAALRHYGLVLWEDGHVESASRALTGAAALKAEDPGVWRDLAGVFGALGHRNEAIACAETSLARDPTQPRMWLQLAAMLMAGGDNASSVEAYLKALDLDDGLLEARLGLGIAYVATKRFREAIDPLREAVRRGKADDPALQNLLGRALYGAGDFEEAALHFGLANRLRPDHRETLMDFARTRFVVDAIEGTAQTALANCERLLATPADVEKTMSDAFHLLSAYEHRRAAISVGALRLARRPEDTMQAYLLAALRGEQMERAPDQYIVSFFDQFADEFEQKLVDVLGYRVPEELATLMQDVADRTNRTIARILDLGCGTGLAGARLAGSGRQLTGVDLSPRMLEKARHLACYNILVEAEAVAFLATDTTTYDLVVAADMLIYFGDLRPIFAAVARVLDQNGLFALSVETARDGRDIHHLSSGRFAHGPSYVERVARETGFAILEVRHTTLRLDAKTPAIGALLLLTKD